MARPPTRRGGRPQRGRPAGPVGCSSGREEPGHGTPTEGDRVGPGRDATPGEQPAPAGAGAKGGKARPAKSTPEQRAEIARKAARAGWAKKKSPGEPRPG